MIKILNRLNRRKLIKNRQRIISQLGLIKNRWLGLIKNRWLGLIEIAVEKKKQDVNECKELKKAEAMVQ